MIGYGSEHTHFIMELTYNYGIKSYTLGESKFFLLLDILKYIICIGNEFAGLTIRSKEVIERAKNLDYPIIDEDGVAVLTSPDGYKFYIINEPQPKDQGILSSMFNSISF